jgi:hypothetical protein
MGVGVASRAVRGGLNWVIEFVMLLILWGKLASNRHLIVWAGVWGWFWRVDTWAGWLIFGVGAGVRAVAGWGEVGIFEIIIGWLVWVGC